MSQLANKALKWKPKEVAACFNKYDKLGEVASLGSKCTFCKLIIDDQDSQKEKEFHSRGLYRDEHCVIFSDIRQDRLFAHY